MIFVSFSTLFRRLGNILQNAEVIGLVAFHSRSANIIHLHNVPSGTWAVWDCIHCIYFYVLILSDHNRTSLSSYGTCGAPTRRAWWPHHMEAFSALLAFCEGNPLVTGGFPSQRPVTRSFDVSLICAWTNGWANNRDAGDLRRHLAHCNVTVMVSSALWPLLCNQSQIISLGTNVI